MPKSNINTALLKQYFAMNPDRAFTFSDLESIFLEHAHPWNLPQSMTPQKFVEILLSRTKLRKLRLQSPDYPALMRYTWGSKISPVSVAISIKDGAFFSHASAMWIHGLTQSHKNIFINKEQSEKRRNPGQLSQEAIHRAFRNQQRRSKLVYEYRDVTITVLNGKHTGRLAVEDVTSSSGHTVSVTSLERTLIDITVRPAYAGGISNVLEAFKLARHRVSVEGVFALLEKFDYTYPYHQSIGFYLNRASYPETDQLLARREPIKFDFYLSHSLRDPAFDPEWRVFFPKSLK